MSTMNIPQAAPSTMRRRAPFLVELFRFVLALYGLVVTAASLLVMLVGDRFWPLALYNTLSHLFWMGAALLLPLAILTRSWRPALTLVLPALALVFSGDISTRNLLTPPISARGSQLTVVSYNLQWRGQGYDAAIDLIRRLHRFPGADVIALQEVSPEAGALIEAELADIYPHMAVHPQRRGYDGQALLSRYPILEDDFVVRTFGQQRSVLDVDGWPLVIYNLHLAVPFRQGWRYDATRRSQEVADLIVSLRGEVSGSRVMVVGDFNMTERNDDYHRLRRDTGLNDAFRSVGTGFGYTWRYGALPPLLRIDYLMHNVNGLRALDARVLEDSGGSDHFPIWGRFDLYDPTLSYPQ